MNDPFKINYDIKTKQVTNMSFQQGNKNVSSIEFTVYEDGKVVNITGETIEFRFVKADKTEVYLDINSGVVIAEGVNGIVTCKLTNDVLSYAGLVKCQIYRKLGTKELFSPTFNFIVKGSLGGDGTLSVNYISQVESKMIEWQGIVDNLVIGAVGEQGIQGIQGIQGLQGLKGDAGLKGDTGLQGIQGISGTSTMAIFVKTQAEYDALPTTKLTDNTLYLIRS